ncbi:clathrin heavy chain [Hanseniaspora valbyensis NRRL Y-1626]|uniref:Clathrin heavy chain n=1 Tax=Hanseniaspora valbyensis NRRL Y-1626 TaxID=766949 RepID=A0A1B7TEH4_9ASCO|nr:clathrin heavy chain [Hanseniaspora valbyensis NRRL Y-1626]
MSDLPIEFTQLADLPSLGIDKKFLEFRSTTFESDKYVLVRETSAEGANTVSIIDLSNNSSIDKKNMGGDNAIMHPSKNVIAVRASGTIGQIFDLDSKQKLKAFTMDDSIVFWKWLNDETLGLVTVNSIYLLNVFDGQVNANPQKLTDRHATLQPCQIIDFNANDALDWLAVVGIYQTEQSTIGGKIQLFNKTRNISQPIDGHACQFSKILLDGNTEKNQIFVIANKEDLKIIEIDHNANLTPVIYPKKQATIFFPEDAASDFPLSCKISEKYGIVYILTKFGFIHLYELETCTDLFVNRISAQPVFTTAYYNNKQGIAAINRDGQVLAVEIEKDAIVPYVLNKLNDVSLALKIASRGNLPGAESLFSKQFDQLIAKGDYNEAAKCAANSGVLRNVDTINRLKSLPNNGGTPPLLIYFSTLLEKGKLNQFETIELAKPVLQQDRKQLFEKWLKEDKLECSEELGDIVKPYDTTLGLACYLRSNAHMKVLTSLVELQQFDKILPYCEKVSFKPNFASLISQLTLTSPDRAADFAISLLNSNVELDLGSIADLFFKNGKIQQGTSFLLDALKQDLPEHGHLQTKLLEINLLQAPQVADAIFATNMCHHYDKQTIAPLCEKAGLYQRALENYSDLKDYKRCITHISSLPMDWILNFFGSLNVNDSLALLRTLMDNINSANKQQILPIIVQISTRFSDLIGSTTLIKFYEEYNSDEGLYYFLSSIVNLTEDPEVVFKYIQAAANSGNVKEVERIVRENTIYDGEKVKNFLKAANLEDQLPLAIVCDKFNFTHELILYLYKKQNFKFIEIYVQQVNPSRTPQVVAALLDVDCDEKTIQALIKTVASTGLVPIGELCEEVGKRNKLRLLLPFLEDLINSGASNDQVIYNTLAKIYIDSNNAPEQFLKENNQYDCADVGRYCEKRDPYLAYIAYEKGDISDDLIRITNENSMFKYQARYLLSKSDLGLWDKVLNDDNMYKKSLIDSVISVGIPELKDAEPISIAVKAFMTAGLKTELINLLEKIILEESPFSSNSALQNLLMVSAIRYDPPKVKSYIEKLEKYDPEEIGSMCVENELYEEAFEIYNSNELYSKALKVILEDMLSLNRGQEYAEKLDQKELWTQLGEAQLNGLRVTDAIESYIKAEDPSNFENVIDIAEHSEKLEELIGYLKMARKTFKEPKIDNTVILVYAQLGKLNEIESFLEGSNTANLDVVGDKLLEKGDFKAAKMCFVSVSNYSKLANVAVHLGDYQEAVDAARKASSVKVWKEVSDVCIEKKEFRLAQVCGLNIIVHAEELNELVDKYESLGYFEELISLFEAGLGLERAHMAMFTELAILYTKYNPGKTNEHLKLFWSRINIPKVIRAVETAHLWPELIFLYAHYDEWDNAALTVIEKSTDNFDHLYFKDIIVKVSNLEIYYKAINFYVEEHPSLLIDLLTTLTPKLDISRTIKLFKNSDNLPLIKPFLINVLPKNLAVVNEAYHDLLIEDSDYKSLKSAVESYDKFDQLALAKELEDHEIIFFKQIAASLYCRNKKWERSLSVLKEQRLWKDAINVATLSQKTEIAEDLLAYFISTGNREAIVALLYSAYNLIRYDYVLEEAWLNGLDDLIKPYEISVRKEQFDLVQKLSKKLEDTSVDGDESEKLMLTNGPSY